MTTDSKTIKTRGLPIGKQSKARFKPRKAKQAKPAYLPQDPKPQPKGKR